MYKCKLGSVMYLRISQFLVGLDEAEKPNRRRKTFDIRTVQNEILYLALRTRLQVWRAKARQASNTKRSIAKRLD